MTTRAYVPYSGFAVGAAAFTTSGQIVRGCNVENVSYGLTLCAECGLVSDAAQQAAGQIIGLAVVSSSGAHCSPCGRCRQLLVEHSTADALIDTPIGPTLISSLLPHRFDQDRLEGG
jgi:cytidine deaminase